MNNTLKIILSKFIIRKNQVAIGIDLKTKQPEVFILVKNTRINITQRTTLIALKPIIISIGIPKKSLQNEVAAKIEIVLQGEIIGALKVGVIEEVNIDGDSFCICKIDGQSTNLVHPVKQQFGKIYLWLQNICNLTPYNLRLAPKELYKLYVYYLIPKPVALISIMENGSCDIFPMDNIGHISKNLFLLGLRNTSPSINKIISTKKICISHIPYSERQHAYNLGTHHKDGKIDIDLLKFKTVPSIKYSYPVPDFSIAIKEVELIETKVYGSHTLFITKIIHKYDCKNENSMAHIPWFAKKVYNLNT